MALFRSGINPDRVATSLLVALFLFISTRLSHGADPGKLPAWEIRNGLSTVYLVGSVHALRDSDYPLPPLFDTLAGKATQFVFELLEEDLNSPSTTQLVQDLGIYPFGKTIYDDIPGSLYSQLLSYLRANNLPRDHFDRRKPWLVSGEIDNREAAKAGFKSELGVEQYFYNLAKSQQKSIRALETAAFQIRLFAETPLSEQIAQLEFSLTRSAENVAELMQLVDHWKVGDVDAIHQILDANQDAASYARFFVNRNRDWAAQIESFLQQKETVLVVAGVAHFGGSDNVIALLRERGLRVEQLPIRPPAIVQVQLRDQTIRLQIRAATTRALTVYSSLDLRTWQPIATLDNATGLLEFTAPQPSASQFYRVETADL